VRARAWLAPPRRIRTRRDDFVDNPHLPGEDGPDA
jgi:hypothetical protein